MRDRGHGSLRDGPDATTPLARAVWVDARAAEVGYDWPSADSARAKVDEELGELDGAVDAGGRGEAERELGDVLLSLVSFARKSHMDVERALGGALARFEARFGWAERTAVQRGTSLAEMTPSELDELWNEAKEAVGRAGEPG